MEYNIKKYQFHQNEKDYVVSTGLIYDRIRITCQENLIFDGPFYSNEFSLYDLRNIHQFFSLTQTIEEALKEINKGIERQKTGLKLGSNDIMHFFGNLILGTDNDIYVLNLKRNFEPNKYGIFTPPSAYAADLILTTNYKVDGERLNIAEINAGNLQREQTIIEEELDKVIPHINKLKRISMDIEEENALIKERIRILQKNLEQKKYTVFRLKEENSNLKRENQGLNNMINNQQNAIRNKQAIQTQMNIKQRPNVKPQINSVVSKFEQLPLRTFFPRTLAKPNIEEYNNNYQDYNNYIYSPEITTELNTYTYNDNISNQIQKQIQVYPSVYQNPQPQNIIIPQTQNIILSEKQPVINYTNYTPPLRLSKITNNVSYNKTTYKAYLKTPSKDIIYKNKLNNPNINIDNNINNINIISPNKNMIKSYSNNNMKLGTLTDNIRSYRNKNLYDKIDNNKQINGISNNKDYIKPAGSRMPNANYHKSPSQYRNKIKNFPLVGYSSYNNQGDVNNNK